MKSFFAFLLYKGSTESIIVQKLQTLFNCGSQMYLIIETRLSPEADNTIKHVQNCSFGLCTSYKLQNYKITVFWKLDPASFFRQTRVRGQETHLLGPLGRANLRPGSSPRPAQPGSPTHRFFVLFSLFYLKMDAGFSFKHTVILQFR
jgi:hypothetical protein